MRSPQQMYQERSRGSTWLRTTVLFLLGAAVTTWAPETHAEVITNGGFETGDFTGWDVELHAGNKAVGASPSDPSTFGAQVLTGDDLFRDEVQQPGVVPPAAAFFALMSTMPSLPEERPPGLEDECPTTQPVDSGADRDGDGNNELDVTTVSQTFTVPGAPAQLSFTWSLLTSESEEERGFGFHDIFLVTLTPIEPPGVPQIVLAVAAGDTSESQVTITELPFSQFDGSTYEVATDPQYRETDCAFFGRGRTPFVTSQFEIPASGTYRLTFLIGDDGPGTDAAGMDSGVLLDSVAVTEATPTATHTPAPPTATATDTPLLTPVLPTATATNTPLVTPVPRTATPSATHTAIPTKQACGLQEGEGAECVTPTTTPTTTHTPVPPTVIPSRTATATVVPATPTAIPKEGDGCSISPAHRTASGTVLLLFIPSALVVWRHRRRTEMMTRTEQRP